MGFGGGWVCTGGGGGDTTADAGRAAMLPLGYFPWASRLFS